MLITVDKNGIEPLSVFVVCWMRVQNIWINNFPLRFKNPRRKKKRNEKYRRKRKRRDQQRFKWDYDFLVGRFIFVWDLHLLFFSRLLLLAGEQTTVRENWEEKMMRLFTTFQHFEKEQKTTEESAFGSEFWLKFCLFILHRSNQWFDMNSLASSYLNEPQVCVRQF